MTFPHFFQARSQHSQVEENTFLGLTASPPQGCQWPGVSSSSPSRPTPPTPEAGCSPGEHSQPPGLPHVWRKRARTKDTSPTNHIPVGMSGAICFSTIIYIHLFALLSPWAGRRKHLIGWFLFSPLAGILVPLTGLASRLLISAGRGSGPVLPLLLTQAPGSTLRFSHRSLLWFPESRAKTELRSPVATCCPSKPRATAESGLKTRSHVPPLPASARPSARRSQRRPGAIFLLCQGPWLSWPAGEPGVEEAISNTVTFALFLKSPQFLESCFFLRNLAFV